MLQNPASSIVWQRLHNQRLVGAPFARPEELVQWFGAVQAQEYAGASWALAQRTTGQSQASIDRAFAEGAILRTHAMRPTWHFVAPADIRWLLALTAPRVHAVNRSYYRKLELDDAVFAQCCAVLERALEGGRQRTREELAGLLNGAGIATNDRLRLSYLMMRAELDGLICSGALRGKQHTYALLEERVPPTRRLERDEALAELTRRFFTSHGPATAKDFAWWSGLSPADVKAGLALSGQQLEQAPVDGHAHWFAPHTQVAPTPSPVAHLLPAYDEYTIAYKEHGAIIDPAFRARVVATSGIVIVIDGQIVGGWKRVLTKDAALLTLSPFAAVGAAESQAIALAVQQYAAFLQRPVVLTASGS